MQGLAVIVMFICLKKSRAYILTNNSVDVWEGPLIFVYLTSDAMQARFCDQLDCLLFNLPGWRHTVEAKVFGKYVFWVLKNL